MKFMILGLLMATLLTTTAIAAEPVKIAFVDTGNTGRSVTAEALANVYIRQKQLNVLVISRAFDLNPYNIVPEPFAAELLAKRGLDVSAHRAVQLTAGDIKHSDLILTMTAKHRDAILAQFPQAVGKVFMLATYAAGEEADVVDAWRQPMTVYEKTFAQIDGYVPLALAKAAKP
jgi:protein-tyrosine phosphatase